MSCRARTQSWITALLGVIAAGSAILPIEAIEAAEPACGRPVSDDADWQRQLATESGARERRIVGVGGIRVGYPQRLTASFGSIVHEVPSTYDCRTVCQFDGLLVQLEPGLAGGRLHVGYARVFGEARRDPRIINDVFFGYAVKGSVLRTWGDSPLGPNEQTFVGVEADLTVVMVNLSAGLYRNVSQGADEDPWIVSASVGWGF